MSLTPLAVAALIALSAPARAAAVDSPEPSAPEIGHVLEDNGIRYEGGDPGCPYGGLPPSLYASLGRRSRALREYRARLAGVAWAVIATSEEAGVVYFFAGPKTTHRDRGAPYLKAYWRAKATRDDEERAANGIAVQSALASDPQLPRLAELWWGRLETASADLKTRATGMRKAEAQVRAKLEAKYGVALTGEALRAPATLVYTAAPVRFGRAVRDCDHWSLYLPKGARACGEAQALFANREAHAGHKDWAAVLGQLSSGGAYFIIESVDPPPGKALTGTFALSKEDVTPESASACEEGRPKPAVVAASKRPRPPAVSDGPAASVWERLPSAEARTAWDKASADCADASVIKASQFGYNSGGSPSCRDARDALEAAGCAMPQDQRLATAEAAGARIESLAEAASFEALFYRACPGETLQPHLEFKVYERWLKDDALPVELRCHALYSAAFVSYLANIGDPGAYQSQNSIRDGLRSTYGLGALCPGS